jgi:hypothetical protein
MTPEQKVAYKSKMVARRLDRERADAKRAARTPDKIDKA